MHRQIWILFFSALLRPISAKGKIEIQLRSFENLKNRDETGRCCSKSCSEKCSPFVRICLKQYQTIISDFQNCTYGSTVMEWDDTKDDGQKFRPLSFPFHFVWTGDLTFIVEVWHAPTGFKYANPDHRKVSQQLLLLRKAQRKTVAAGDQWTQEIVRNSFSRLELQYRVSCDENYYGKDCAAYCKPRDDTFGHYSCSPVGRKVCVDGWRGEACNEAQCLPGCHPEFGSCSKPNECKCRLGYEGPFCDQCMRYPGCQHGTCKVPFECNCDEGWGGLFCNQDLNYCTHHKPCLNGATCTNTGAGHYTCNCRAGYTGVNCETKIETCDLRPCFNGATCRESGTNYTCLCPEGHSGKHCQTFAKTCAENPCENGASCLNNNNGTSGYQCLCAPGWEGVNCDTEMDLCQASPCENGASCLSHFGSFTCLCPTGYTGDRCEINRNDCSAQSCLNGGQCIDEVDNFKCKCRAGFFGTLCQFNVDDCVKRPCANGGTCFDLVNDYRCECRPGFKGKDCSIDVNECESAPCRFGATCEDLVDDFLCHCLPCYSGKDCRQRDLGCLERHHRPFVHPRNFSHSRTTPDPRPPARPAPSHEPKIDPYVILTHSKGLYSSQNSDLNSNLPLLIGLPLVAIFIVIMIILIVIILCLLRKYKIRSSPSSSDDQNDDACRRENLHNMKLAAKNLKNEHNLVIYNNTKGDNRVPGKNFDDDKICDYQKMKNNLNVSDQNDTKIYKIDDDSTSSPRFANNLYDNNSCDSINRTMESSCDKLSTIGQLTPLRTEDLRMTPFTNLYRQHHKHSTE